jgi:extracellular factor (EF) 3-hydroxypalmitic acid methyl ester biosynthesis protein
VDEVTFAYSLGLFDYLEDATCRRIIQGMYRLLSPSGRLVVANFSTTPDCAYLEAAADWWLVYRKESDMERLVPVDVARDAARVSVRNDGYCLVLLEIEKRIQRH